MQPKGLLIDVTRCIGCGACVEACQEANGLPKEKEPPKVLSAKAYTVVQEKAGGKYVRRLCMHCVTPACASACPVAALHKTPEGPVDYDWDRCMGCRYCMIACPFEVPTYEWDKPLPRVRKCILCSGRLKEGKPTACSEACPAEATVFGERAALVAEAHRRIKEAPAQYKDVVFGEAEVGGTSVLYLADVAMTDLGFPVRLPGAPLPQFTERVLSKIPGVVLVGGAFLFGMHWLTDRKNELAAAPAPVRDGGRKP